MKKNFSALTVGLIFAMGLSISGMTQPQKVVGFLDIFGEWDPSLIFVMVGAIVVHAIAFKLIRRRANPWFSEDWHIPNRKDVNPALVVGSFIFGVGWAMGGYCPGPAITSLATLEYRPIVFVLSMVMGMVVFRIVDGKFKFKK
jgi:uncharacterized protein